LPVDRLLQQIWLGIKKIDNRLPAQEEHTRARSPWASR
jgi:hypothetical protein